MKIFEEKLMKKMLLLSLSIGITSCLGGGGGGDGSSTPTASSNALVETYAGVAAQTKKIGGLASTSLTAIPVSSIL
jgi:hypothetical protein